MITQAQSKEGKRGREKEVERRAQTEAAPVAVAVLP